LTLADDPSFAARFALHVACPRHARPHVRRRLAAARARQRRNFDGRHRNVNVEPIDQGAAQARAIALSRFFGARAPAPRVREVAARTRIDGADDEGPRREPCAGAGNAHLAVFERLAKRFERAPAKLGELVEKQDSVVRETHLAGARSVAAADETGLADGVVRRAEGAQRDDSLVGGEQPGDAVDRGRLHGFFEAERREHARQKPREHRLAQARVQRPRGRL
jgi:hypothetical protein